MMRTERTIKNFTAGLLGQILTILLGFVTRTVFIYTLSAEYLGLSGLFTSILTMLNLTEVGIGVSIMYALYKPLAQNDEEKVYALMSFYKRAYQIIGLLVLIIGMCLMPFIPSIIKSETNLANVRILFLLYILESVSTYWVLAYKRTLLEANQQKYIVSLYNFITSIFISLLRISLLVAMRNRAELSYYCYVGVGIAGQIVNNLILSKEVNKRFPYLKDGHGALSQEDKTPIRKNIAGVFISKLSGIMLNSVDNILISAFISIATVGVYSNYIALRTYIRNAIGLVFDSAAAGIGDFCATESAEMKETLFKGLQFTCFWIYGFCGICFWVLLNPFIGGVWLGKEYLLSSFSVFLVSINFVLDGLAGAVIRFRDAHGLYWQAKYRYLLSAVFNGILSYLLIKPMGIEGVLLGTTASIIVMLSFDPIVVFKNVFKKSAARYYFSYLGYLAVVLLTGGLVSLITFPLKAYSFRNFMLKLTICIVVPNSLWYLFFRKIEQMGYIKNKAAATISFLKGMLER